MSKVLTEMIHLALLGRRATAFVLLNQSQLSEGAGGLACISDNVFICMTLINMTWREAVRRIFL